MAEKTQKEMPNKEMLRELCQAVIGIPSNPDDNGIIGDIADIKELVGNQNNRIRKNEVKIGKMWGILIGICAVGGTGLGIGIKELLSG